MVLKLENIVASISPKKVLIGVNVACICKLPASLKDDKARMNNRNKNKVKGQMNHQKADTKANASLFFFTTHFLKTILACPQVAHLALPLRRNPTLHKAKLVISLPSH